MTRPSSKSLARWGAGLFVLVTAWLWLSAQGEASRSATALALADAGTKALEEALLRERPGQGERYDAVLLFEGAAGAHAETIEARLSSSKHLRVEGAGFPLQIALDLEATPAQLQLRYAARSAAPVEVKVDTRPVSGLAIFPPLLAIVLALVTGRLLLSLTSAVASAALLAAEGGLWQSLVHAWDAYFWSATFTEAFNLWILVFTTSLIGLVALATRAGGVQGIVNKVARWAKDARSAQLATAGMGLAVFFDDYANTVLVGSTMRPLTDRLRVSREKLAYIVDSTSAPVAGLAFISTWIGYEVGLLGAVGKGLGVDLDGYAFFFAALPYRFYCLAALALLALLLWARRDFGPMLKAERRAHQTGAVIRPDATPLSNAGFGATVPKEGIPHLASVAAWPIGLVLAATLLGLFYDGGGLARLQASPLALLSWRSWRDTLAAAENSTFVLAMASLAGSLLLFVLVRQRKLLGTREALGTYGRGVISMYLAVAILILAWAMKAVADDLGTNWFLVAALQGNVPAWLLPLLIFLVAAITAFATGTSWGTMGILIPTAVPLAYHLGDATLMYMSMAAVLDGAIFGDHCSPISDTTVMSSIASGSDHLDHVRTQAPYAVTAMAAAALFGYVWSGREAPYLVGLLLGLAALAAVVFALGRDPRAEAPASGS